MKPKYVDEWKLDTKAKKEVKRQLKTWVNVFVKRADAKLGTVRRCNFKENDLFYFTDCQDILNDLRLSKEERRALMHKRKQQVLMQLFLNELISGKPIVFFARCTHCGNTRAEIISLGGIGFTTFCPDCNRTIIDTYTPYLSLAIEGLQHKLEDRGVDMRFEK